MLLVVATTLPNSIFCGRALKLAPPGVGVAVGDSDGVDWAVAVAVGVGVASFDGVAVGLGVGPKSTLVTKLVNVELSLLVVWKAPAVVGKFDDHV